MANILQGLRAEEGRKQKQMRGRWWHFGNKTHTGNLSIVLFQSFVRVILYLKYVSATHVESAKQG